MEAAAGLSKAQGTPDVIITVDDAGVIQFANPATVSQFGYAAAELVGKEAAVLFQTKDDWTATWANAIRSGVSSRPRELLAVGKDGTPSHLEASASGWKTGSRVFLTVISTGFRRIGRLRVLLILDSPIAGYAS